MADYIAKDFHMSFADLITLCNNVHVFVTRDATEFATFGVDSAEIDAFETLIDAFEVLPTDDIYAGDVMTANQNIDSLSSELLIMLRAQVMREKLAFGEDSGEYSKVHKKDISRLSIGDLLIYGRMVVLELTDNLTELTPFGLTQPMIDDLSDKCQALEDAGDAKASAVAARDTATNDRTKKANALYALLAKYCDIGKTIWYETDESKYNDYIIYGVPSPGAPDAPTNLDWKEDLGMFVWDAILDATSYQLMYKAPTAEEWVEAYSGEFASATFDPGHGTWEFKVRARNAAGYGNYSDDITIVVPGGLAAPDNVSVVYLPAPDDYLSLTWDAVSGATSYKLYQCIVNIGQPSGIYTSPEFPVTSPHIVNTPTSGKRYYFKVAAMSATEMSVPSAETYAEVS